jgi:hypothetical protein
MSGDDLLTLCLTNRYLDGVPASHAFDTAPIIAALNIVLAKHATNHGVVVGTNRFFFPTEKSPLDGLLEAYKGKFVILPHMH